MKDIFDLKDKVTVVIGGTGTLCSKIAWGFFSCGAKVIIAGRNADRAEKILKEWEASDNRAKFVKVDVTKKDSIENLLDTTLSWAGKIDILINGAGTNSSTPFLEISEEEFYKIIDTNVKSVFLACQIFGKWWLENKKRGSIINITSMSAIRPLSKVFTYSMSKAAVLNLTQNLAREWANNGIRVNALCPGFFPAQQNRAILSPERVKAILSHTPMKRFGEPDDLIASALLLGSDKAASFITGINLVVDGGFSVVSI